MNCKSKLHVEINTSTFRSCSCSTFRQTLFTSHHVQSGDTINVRPKPITFNNGQEISKTRMHSSRIRTTRSLQYGGPPNRDPLDRDPLHEQRPPGQRPPGQRPLDRDPDRDPTGQRPPRWRLPWMENPFGQRLRPPLDRQTPMKT